MIAKNTNTRINARANAFNKAIVFGLVTPKDGLFKNSFNNDGTPMYAELIRYERTPNYNNHSGKYN